MRARPSLDVATGAALIVATIWSYATYARLAWTRPTLDDYRSASTQVRERFRPGDLIDFYPHYATRAREWLGDLPNESYRNPAREDFSRYRRLWLFSSFGAESDAAVRDGPGRGAELIEDKRFGNLDVRLYRLAEPAHVLFDFRERLEVASVRIDRTGGGSEPCSAWRAGRSSCDKRDWNYVGREILEMDAEPRAVIWAHPVDEGVKVIEYANVPLGRAIVGRSGLTAWAARDAPTPVVFVVSIDGHEVLRRSDGPADTFAAFRIDTAEYRGGRHRVSVSVSTAFSGSRHWAFHADARD